MATSNRTPSSSAGAESAADEKSREPSANSRSLDAKNVGERGDNPRQARVRGSGYTETDAHQTTSPQAAPETKGTARVGSSQGPAAVVGGKAATPSHPRGSDANDQLANGKSAPRGTNTNGGVSNEPRSSKG